MSAVEVQGDMCSKGNVRIEEKLEENAWWRCKKRRDGGMQRSGVGDAEGFGCSHELSVRAAGLG